jgi:hypothetical protein
MRMSIRGERERERERNIKGKMEEKKMSHLIQNIQGGCVTSSYRVHH